MMGDTRFSPEGKLIIGLRKAGDYYGEGQFHDGRHPVLSRRKVAHWAEKSRILLWGRANFMMGGTLFYPEGNMLIIGQRKVVILLWGRPISG